MSNTSTFSGYADKVVHRLESDQQDFRSMPLLVSVPYKLGAGDFALENLERELKQQLSDTLKFPNRAHYEPFDEPFQVRVKSRNELLAVCVFVDTFKHNYKGEALTTALDAARKHVHREDRKLSSRYKQWRQRRLDAATVEAALKAAREKRMSHG